MSAKIMGQVWDCDLPHNEMLVLLALSDHADHEGNNVYPSINLVAWKTGYSERQVQRIMRRLEGCGVLVVVAPATHQKTTVYRIDLAQAKQKPSRDRGVKMSPVTQLGVTSETARGDILTPVGVTFCPVRGDTIASPEPSWEPSLEPSWEELHAPLERAEPAVPAPTPAETVNEENFDPNGSGPPKDHIVPPPQHATARTPRKAAARDPLLDHPAVVAYRDTCKLTPNATQRQLIAEAVGEQVADWQETLTHWMAHGWRPQNVAGMLDAYRARDKPAPAKDPRYLKAQIPFDLSNMLDPTECPRYYRRWEQETPEGRVILEQRIREGAGAR